jgi:hypothetical protein
MEATRMCLSLVKWMDFCAFPSGRVVVGSFGSSGLNVNNNNNNNNDDNRNDNNGLGGLRKFSCTSR